MPNTTMVNKVADRLRYGSMVRVGFDQNVVYDGIFACVTTTSDRARSLISAARRQIIAEDRFFMTNWPDVVYLGRPGVATHKRDGYVLGHWRKPGQARCNCDVA